MAKELSFHDKAVLNIVFNPSLPIADAYQDEIIEELTDFEEDCADLKEVKRQEFEAISKAENKDNENALKILNSCINIMPKKASLYNNRAQVYQLIGNFEDALKDVTKAIELAEEKQKKTLCSALCQRGLLHRKYNRMELARHDFTRAAELGSQFAKTQLVDLNPYAALCNQMLRKVMDELK